jgi:hypothetical protein
MGLKFIHFLSPLFTALPLAPALAHPLELPKIGLSHDAYLTVQQIYRGWALLGGVVIGALVFTLILTIMVRHQPTRFRLALVTFWCISASRLCFGRLRILPIKRQTTGRCCRRAGKRCVGNGSTPTPPVRGFISSRLLPL